MGLVSVSTEQALDRLPVAGWSNRQPAVLCSVAGHFFLCTYIQLLKTSDRHIEVDALAEAVNRLGILVMKLYEGVPLKGKPPTPRNHHFPKRKALSVRA